MLNTLMEEMRYKGAPDALVKALACLLDARVAQKAYELFRRVAPVQPSNTVLIGVLMQKK